MFLLPGDASWVMTIEPLGDSAAVVTLGDKIDAATLQRVRSLAAALELTKSPAIVDIVPAYTTVTVVYEIAPTGVPVEPPYHRICRTIEACSASVEHSWPDVLRENLDHSLADGKTQLIEIPVCYGGLYGPDIDDVARRCGLSVREVVELHSSATYDVHAVGFAPGFPYLGGLDERLHTPRKNSPRLSVPEGSVGIGGAQTGVYPLSTPGGWQLIGRTPQRLFDLNRNPAAMLRVGDRVKFARIDEEAFARWR